nr:acyltransferase [Neobacillus sp. Marseille-Q6967]
MGAQRDRKIDILRFIAIMCIILAHSQPNEFIFQLRNFDVTLMVLLLGVSFYLSNKNKEINYFNYVFKRFKRLVVPTWNFLTLFFFLFFIISIITGDKYYFNLKDIITSYVMIDGIGYVWIMKVFFIVAVISPLILNKSNKIKDNKVYLIMLMGWYTLYALLVFIHHGLIGKYQLLFEHFILHGFGYSLIAALGIRLYLFKLKELLFICVFFLLVFTGLMILHDYNPTQQFKYPPTMYYFSYGLFVSFFLYLLLHISFITKMFNNKFVFFLSENSLWLYFWHIIPIYILQIFSSKISFINNNFVTRFVFIFLVALLITYVHKKLKSKENKVKFSSSKTA